MPYRNKTFVSFDGDNDMHYYRLMTAWKQNDGIDFNFHNAHDLNTARDSSTEESIKAQLAERLRNSKLFILLVGERTRYLTKFVAWEIDRAISLKLPMVIVNINGKRSMDPDRCPRNAQEALAVHVPFSASIIQYAMDNWPSSFDAYQRAGKSGAYYYRDEVYRELGYDSKQ